MGVSMEMSPFTMTSFQSAYGQVAAWCEYSSSETDGRIANDNSLQLAVVSYTLNFTLGKHRSLKVKGCCDDGSVQCPRV